MFMKFLSTAFHISLLCSFLCVTVNCANADIYPDPEPYPGHEEYLRIIRDTGNGITDRKGRVIIPPDYKDVQYVGMKRFVVRRHEKKLGDDVWYLMNDKGKTLTKLPMEAGGCEPYSEGILRLGYGENMTYLNLRGEPIFKQGTYSYGSDFSCGLASVSVNNSKSAESLRGSSKKRYQYRGASACDVMSVEQNPAEGSTLAYINKHGKIVLGPFPNTEGYPFQNGLAVVGDLKGPKTLRAGVIDTKGNFVIPKVYDSIDSANGKYFFARKDGKSVLLSAKNQVIAHFPDNSIMARFPEVLNDDSLVSCQFAVNENGESKVRWGYCNLAGKVVIQPLYDHCSWDGKDTFAVSIKDIDDYATPGTIDRQGNWIKKPELLSTASAEQLSRIWKANTPQRSRVFCQFLKRSDFIGMNQSELIAILGVGSEDATAPAEDYRIRVYNLTPGSMCGYGIQQLKFKITKNSTVSGWLIEGLDDLRETTKTRAWITHNVIPDVPKLGLKSTNLVDKKRLSR